MVIRHELRRPRPCARPCALGGLLAPGDPGCDLQRRRAGRMARRPRRARRLGAADDVLRLRQRAPAPRARVGAFRIARRPVTNATWLHFTEGGGYQRREWWSDEGWAWKEDYDIGTVRDAEAGHPDAPVCHVSWFEADAFARSRGARLPTEAEWEKAATWTHKEASRGSDRSGSGPRRGSTATRLRRPPVSRVLGGLLRRAYRVLRGGSWATDPRVATVTFRNWDLPQRRQIFAGVRLATDHEESR